MDSTRIVTVSHTELETRRSSAARPAAGPLRTGPGTRCRCRAPVRPAAAKATTAAITGENRAMAPGAEVVAVGEPTGQHERVDACGRLSVAVPHDLGLAAERAATASTTSASQFVPGNSTTPTVMRRRSSADGAASSITGLVRNRWHRSCDLGPAPPPRRRLDREPDGLADRDARRRRRSRAWAATARSVAPWGSAMPGRRRTSTSTENVTPRSLVSCPAARRSAPGQSAKDRPVMRS